MKQCGAFDAKTHFSELLSNVASGEKYVITKHGVKIALLIPFTEDDTSTPGEEAVRTIRKLSKGIKLGPKLSIRQLREEGRR